MRPSVRRDRRIACGICRGSDRTIVMSEAAIAASVPEPIAMPRSAPARAAASLMPSPTIATERPSAWSSSTTAILPSGRTSAKTSVIPSLPATASAAEALSPVSSTARRPRRWSSEIAEAAPSLTSSATNVSPRKSPSTASATIVAPAGTASGATSTVIPRSPSRSGRPAMTSRPSILASSPPPGIAAKSSTLAEAVAAPAVTRSARDASTIARATGCSLCSSRRASTAKSASDSCEPMSVITPVVRVPVLSSTTVSIDRVDSSASGPETRIPSCEPRPEDTARAVGVASPSAQGHAMMSTVSAACRPIAQSPLMRPHARNVSTLMTKTIGTNTAEMRSARRCTAGLPSCARLTRSAIAASVVSAPTRSARTSSTPEVLIVAPVTVSPTPTSTGADSPVSIASSTAE